MGVARGPLLRNLLGSLAVLATLGAISIGLPAIDRALPAERAVATIERYRVGGGVSVVPPPGARVDVTATRPGFDRGTALFLVGPVRYAIVVAPFAGSLSDAAARLRNKITAVRGHRVAGEEFAVRTATGLAGLKGDYTAPGSGGWYAIFRAGELAIEVTVSSTDPQPRPALDAVAASTRSLSYRGGR